jgi:histone acetyltransferase (RNA polymerase elongator complex component)
MIFPIFLPHVGCGQRCIYCNQDIITNGQPGDPADIIGRALSQIQPGSEVALYGGNPLGLDPQKLEALLSLFDPWKETISSIRISAKPGRISQATVSALKKHGVNIIELGMPVFNDRILQALGRGHRVEDFSQAYDLLVREGFTIGIQVMVGLPGEEASDLRQTAQRLKEMRPASLRIYPLLVLKETPLETLYRAGVIQPVSLDEAVERALFIYLNAWKDDIAVIKMGLTENDVLRENIIAGPFHPAFGYLVKASAFCQAVARTAADAGLSGDVIVGLNRSDIPHLIGYRRSNIELLKKQGLVVEWEKADVDPGHFRLRQGTFVAAGEITKALAMIPF